MTAMSATDRTDTAAFDLTWLDLREAADRRARNQGLVAKLASLFAGAGDRTDGLAIVDLGAGHGASARALAPYLAGPQRWILVDRDEGLLAAASERLVDVTDAAGHRIAVGTERFDLARGALDEAIEGADLVTLSAFLDLASRGFAERLAEAAAAAGALVLATLSVDGRLAIEPSDPIDTAIFDAFNAHMTRDKGFGPALGPRAPDIAAHVFRANGFRVELGRSDWVLGPEDAGLATALVDGWATAAAETDLVDPAALARWRERRAAEAAAGRLRIVVGHLDMLAVPLTR